MLKTKQTVWVLLSILLAVAVLGSISYAEIIDNDNKVIADLAAVSSLPQATVVELIDVTGSSETVKENIFVYKKILNISQASEKVYSKIFNWLANYQADDLLAIMEFLDANGLPLEQTEQILAEYTAGKPLAEILALETASEEYKAYQPAEKEQVRLWLAQGYLPQDIINADAIAMEKDMNISDVLALKTGDITWEEIESQLGCLPKNGSETVSVNIRENGDQYTVEAADYEDLVKKINEKAEEKKLQLKEKFLESSGLTNTQLDKYLNQGLNIHEVENAVRLSKKSGVTVDKILKEKQDGMSWESIIEKYNGKGGKEAQ